MAWPWRQRRKKQVVVKDVGSGVTWMVWIGILVPSPTKLCDLGATGGTQLLLPQFLLWIVMESKQQHIKCLEKYLAHIKWWITGSMKDILASGTAWAKAGRWDSIRRVEDRPIWFNFPPLHPGWYLHGEYIVTLSAGENQRKYPLWDRVGGCRKGQLMTLSGPCAKWGNGVILPITQSCHECELRDAHSKCSALHITPCFATEDHSCWIFSFSETSEAEAVMNLTWAFPFRQFQNIAPSEHLNHSLFQEVELTSKPQPQNYWDLENFIKREVVTSRTTSSL